MIVRRCSQSRTFLGCLSYISNAGTCKVQSFHHTLLQVQELEPELLLAILLAGAHFSADQNEANQARRLTSIAEIFLFRDQAFDASATKHDGRGLQLAQAALLICQLQLRNSDRSKREYVRCVLFQRLVAVSIAFALAI